MSTDFTASEVQAVIRTHTGPVADFQRTARGFSSDVTAIVECEKGPFFIKAIRNRPGGRRDSLTRERQINPFVWPISPALRWHAEDESWIVLGFEAVEGRSSDFGPDSADLSSVVELIDCIGKLQLPPVAEDWPETRWDPFVRDDSEAELLRGDALLHTDINPSNLLVGPVGMWAVDWAWPTRGAAFIDPAILALQLVSAGHSPESAESWASRCTAWRDAEPQAIDAFAAAQLRLYRVALGRKPDQPWLHDMVSAARSWVDHRGVAMD
ncbi:protein kinase [Streptomyces adelaidensis]|uniref:protein kinase n=1 Tax=Streptomyces adelaidensis TaxID=2796465 RepID=UPI001F3968E3|nr:protein kinase [Streptomyces adelaidensis]